MADLRGLLGEDRYRRRFEHGARLSLDEAIHAAIGTEKDRTPAPDAEDLPGAAPVTGRPPLTPRETQVAEVVALGRSNRQIAEALLIAERTAEGHVEHIMGTLGFTSRAQIAAWVVGESGS
jgi:DNA-binding NarL/FixJ family response regulator